MMTKHAETSEACSLCSIPVGKRPISDAGKSFCCPGCHAVYNILSARNELASFEQSPVFQRAVVAGLISNATLLERLRDRSQEASGDDERQKIHLEISDLWCPSCAQVIQWIVMNVRGAYRCVVDYATDIAIIEFSPLKTSKESLMEAIRGFGYHPIPLEDRVAGKVSRSLYLRFVIAAFCALNIMMFSYPIYASYFNNETAGFSQFFGWLSWLAALPVVIYCAWPLYRHAWTGARAGFFGMESLVVLAIAASFGYSTYEVVLGEMHVYFDALSVIVTFVLLGKIIETRAKFSAKESILQLARYLPRRARRREEDGTEAFVALKDVRPGDLLVALMGEKIVLEGVVVEGQATVDQSVMTGEALPVVKRQDSDVLSGTVIKQGSLVYRVTTTQEQSLLQQVVGMVEQDLQHKGTYVRAADAVTRWFVPIVIALACVTVGYVLFSGTAEKGHTSLETAILRAMAVLLISCPCAIGIAGPLAESLLMNSLAAAGVIVRNRACLRHLGRETAVVFDKTGTITKGCFEVRNGLERLTPEERRILKGLASQSIHPLSAAIMQSIEDPVFPLEQVEEIVGRGILGSYQGRRYLLGSEVLLQQFNVQPLPAMTSDNAAEIASHVLFAKEGSCLARIILGDDLREGAANAVQCTMPAKSYLVSGDAIASVADVAKRCGFSDWRAGFSPLEKRQFIEDLRSRGHRIAMVGDGVNDASALAGAHIGISVVSATDVSIQVSDILLASDNLDGIAVARKQACRSRRIISQNIGWAFSYNIVGIGLAMGGALTPIYSAIAMVASSLLVLFNALRLR